MLRRATAAITASPCRLTSASVGLFGTRSFATKLEDNNRSTPSGWEQFLRGGQVGATHADVEEQPGGKVGVRVSWGDGHRSEFSAKWLRDHAAEAFNPNTKQREVNGLSTCIGGRGRGGGGRGRHSVCSFAVNCVSVHVCVPLVRQEQLAPVVL